MNRNPAEILAEHEAVEKQLADLRALQQRLEAEIAQATEAGDVADEKFIASLQVKKSQLELLPRKLGQLEAKLAPLATELKGIAGRLVQDARAAYQVRRDELTGHLAGEVRKLFPDAETAAIEAGKFTLKTVKGAALFELFKDVEAASGGSSTDAARRLMNLLEQIQGFKI